MIADGVLHENYNYNDVPLLTGENPLDDYWERTLQAIS